MERVYAGRVLRQEERAPVGALAREAITELLLRGSIFKGLAKRSARNREAHALAARLSSSPQGKQLGLEKMADPPSLEDWTLQQLATLGVERGDDLALLSEEDLLHPELSAELAHVIEGEFPREVSVGDALYAVDYELDQRRVILRIVKGQRSQPPPAQYLPRFEGFRVYVEAGRRLHEVRRR